MMMEDSNQTALPQAVQELKDLALELRDAAALCLFEVQCETWPGSAGALFSRAADAIDRALERPRHRRK